MTIEKTFNLAQLDKQIELISLIIDSYNEGKSAYEIATIYEVSRETVYRILKANGIERRPRNSKGK